MTSTKNIILIIFLLLALVATLTLTFRTAVFSGRTTSPGSSSAIVLDNSYLFASPLRAKAFGINLPSDSQEQIRITAFILDGRGFGIANHSVDLKTQPQPGLVVTPIQSISDSSGKTIFDISGSSPGQYQITAIVDATKTIPQTINITFY